MYYFFQFFVIKIIYSKNTSKRADIFNIFFYKKIREKNNKKNITFKSPNNIMHT